MKRLWQYSLLVAFALHWTPRARARTIGSEPPLLTVCVMNDAGLSDEVVRKIQKGVDTLFADSGITLRWIRGADPGRTVEERWSCEHPEALQRVVIRWMKSGLQASPNELGEAFLDASGKGVIADLFLDKVERATTDRGVDFTLLLAYLTAHELGHLLLGGEPHAVSGLMQARLSEKNLTKMMQGAFAFSRAEQKKIRARMRAAEQSTMAARQRPGQYGR